MAAKKKTTAKSKNDPTSALQAAAETLTSEETASASAAANKPAFARPRLKRLTIQNLGCIGPSPVHVDLDEIVVLVGRNNAGKSTVLRAYQLAMLEQSKGSHLSSDDFHGGVLDPSNPPRIELETVVDPQDSAPGKKWICNSGGEFVVRERWTWFAEGEPPKRQGWDPALGDWAPEGMPWGAGNVAQAYRPEPHRIEAFELPSKAEGDVEKLLLTVLNESVKSVPSATPSMDGTPTTLWAEFIAQIANVQKSVVAHTKTQIETVEAALTAHVQDVFRGYRVKFEPNIEEDLDATVNLFKSGGRLLMGPDGGYSGVLGKQGSGARRTLMWAAIRLLSEKSRKVGQTSRPHVLLIDEPELCLHPNAVREARRVLYDLPRSGNWQVMVTTHSPVFVDLSRDNTTVVRVERQGDGKIQATTVFRGKSQHIDDDDRRELKLLNLIDPHVAEFFFGGHVVLVEGDTEYTAFNYVISNLGANEPAFRDVHVVRARGKVTIALLARILNAFGARYAVLHDSDSPTTTTRKQKVIANPAWTNNGKILAEVSKAAPGQTRLVASIKDFETAVFGTEAEDDKPYEALRTLQSSAEARGRVEALLRALVAFDKPLPPGFSEWADLDDLKARWTGAVAPSAAPPLVEPPAAPPAVVGSVRSANVTPAD